jgi:hypothetical protein
LAYVLSYPSDFDVPTSQAIRPGGRHIGRSRFFVSAGPPDSLQEYHRLLAYLRHADAYYVKSGKPTAEPGIIRSAVRPLRQLSMAIRQPESAAPSP